MHVLPTTILTLTFALSATAAAAAKPKLPDITAPSSLVPGISSLPTINPSTFDTTAISGTVSQGVITESNSAIPTSMSATVTTKANGMSTTISDDAGAAVVVGGNLGVIGGLVVMLLGL